MIPTDQNLRAIFFLSWLDSAAGYRASHTPVIPLSTTYYHVGSFLINNVVDSVKQKGLQRDLPDGLHYYKWAPETVKVLTYRAF